MQFFMTFPKLCGFPATPGKKHLQIPGLFQVFGERRNAALQGEAVNSPAADVVQEGELRVHEAGQQGDLQTAGGNRGQRFRLVNIYSASQYSESWILVGSGVTSSL